MSNDFLKSQIIRALGQGIRFDGRKPEEWRKIEVEYNVTKNSEGSARVRIGNTEVIAGVKMAIETPYPDTPDEATFMVGTELLPMSSPEFEAGPPDVESIEISRVVDRGIREAKALDVKKLCIEPGKKVWSIAVDICSINNDGNLLDTSALATVAALKQTRLPKYEKEVLDYKHLTDQKLPIRKLPLSVTVCKIGEYLIVDPSIEEEKVLDARLTIASGTDGTISALQKGGDAALSIEELDRMMQLGMAKTKELLKALEGGA